MKKKTAPVDWKQRVADEVARYIETNDTLPWLRPWNINGIFPTNLQTKHEYRGINALLLGMYMGGPLVRHPLLRHHQRDEEVGGPVQGLGGR